MNIKESFKMKSAITELLGIEYPIFQGGMAWIAESTLAAAVSNAGGLGIIAGGSAPIDYLRDQIRRGAGNPGKFMAAWKEAGVKVVPVVPSVALAVRMERAGADAVIAEGTESGGHIGENTTMCLVPQVVDAVSIPVIAAGGIADGRGVAASFMLGAQGVQVGTRFLAADECQIHPTYKELVVKAKDTDSVVTGRYTGHPCRNVRTKFAKKLASGEKDGSLTPDEFEQLTLGSLRKAVQDGNLEEGSFLCGAIAGMIKEVKPAKAIIEEMFAQADKLLGK